MQALTLPVWTPVLLLDDAAPVWLQTARVSMAAGFPSPAEDHQVERTDVSV